MTRMIFFLAALSACTTDPTVVPTDDPTVLPPEEDLTAAPEITGTYVDDYGSEHVITEDTWTMYGTSVFQFVEVHNNDDYLIAENDAANDYYPGLFSRIEWFNDGTDTWFCQIAFDAADLDAALAAGPADNTALSTDGWNGFAWSKLLEPPVIDLTEAPDFVGTYVDPYGTSHEVGEDVWTMGGDSTFTYVEVHNSDHFLIAQNGTTNAYNPDLYSRFDWFDDGTDVWFCQIAYDAADLAAALATPAADSTDVATTGCGGFPWTQLLPPPVDDPNDAPSIQGTYVDNYGSDHVITATDWTSYGTSIHTFVEVHNSENYLIAQNDAANEYFPSLYSRFDWFDDGTDLWYCQIAYDAVDVAAAIAAGPADTSTPAVSGCGGAPWSQLLVP